MSWNDNGRALNAYDLEYLSKIDWLWNRLSPLQRSKVKFSVDNGTLRQENSRSCFISQAVGINGLNAIPHENLLLDIVLGFANAVFYDGPSYDRLLGRKATREERWILDDIYYAKIGSGKHQYRRANELIRRYMLNGMTVT